MNLDWRLRLVLGGSVVAAALAYVGVKARATAPSSVPVTFSGYLQNNGVVLIGQQSIAFDLWDDATATDAAFHVCSMPATTVTVGSDGYFQLPLSAACVTAFPTHPFLWYQFTVDSTVFPRVPIGAVPFALWAGAASNVLKPVTLVDTDAGTVLSTFVSTLGGYCGQTAATTGSFIDPSYQTTGIAAAKTLCQASCGSPTAHICVRDDLDRFRKTLGFNPIATTGWVEDTLGECVPENLSCGCNGSGVTISGGPIGPVYGYGGQPVSVSCTCGNAGGGTTWGSNGTTYGAAGMSGTPCNTSLPILCCD